MKIRTDSSTHDRLTEAFMNGLLTVLGHVVALATIGLIGLILWILIVAPTIGVDTHVVQIRTPFIVASGIAYIIFVIARRRWQ